MGCILEILSSSSAFLARAWLGRDPDDGVVRIWELVGGKRKSAVQGDDYVTILERDLPNLVTNVVDLPRATGGIGSVELSPPRGWAKNRIYTTCTITPCCCHQVQITLYRFAYESLFQGGCRKLIEPESEFMR